MDRIVSLLFALVGTEENAMKWMFSYNTALEGRPVDLIADSQEDKVYSYLHFYVYGPY